MDLTGEDLQKIFISPKHLKFGRINVNSVAINTFSIRNELKGAIQGRLDIDDIEDIELYENSYRGT